MNIYDHVTTTPEETIENDLSTGESVAIGPGTHTISLDSNDEGITVSSDDVTIWIHPNATIKLADGETATDTNGDLFQIADGVSGVTIEGDGTFDGNKAHNTTPSDVSRFGLVRFDDNVSDLTIRGNLTFKNSPGDAIRAHASTGNRAEGMKLTGATLVDCVEGFVWTRVDDVLIDRVTVENMTQQDGLEPVRSDGWTIQNVTIENTGQQGIDCYTGAVSGTISNVVLKNTTSSSVSISGDNARDITISNTISIGSSGDGFDVFSGASNISFDNCVAKSCAGRGFRSAGDEAEFHNCRAIGNDDDGFRLAGARCKAKTCTAKDNNQAGNNNFAGIRVSGSEATVMNCEVYDTQDTPTQHMGIYFQSGAHGLCEGNKAYQNARHGFFFDTTYVEARNNTAFNNSQESTNDYDGMRCTGSVDYAVVQGNRLYDHQSTATQRFGMTLGACTNSLIEDTVTHGNSSGGISDNSDTSTTVEENHAL